MNVFVRMVTTFVRALFRSKLGLFEESRLRLRVWPNDFDAYLHLNNGRYLSMMDLGRFDLVIRNGLGRIMWTRKWFPVVGSSMIRYRRPIDAFRSYDLYTSLVGWDEKWMYIAHRFEKDGELMAAAIIQGVFKGAEGTIAPTRMFRELGHDAAEAVRMPQWIVEWQGADAEMKNRARAHSSHHEASPED